MGLFGKKRQPGISAYELTKKRLHARLRSVFSYGARGDRQMAALDAALHVGLDPDHNTPSTQHVIQSDEFNTALDTLVRGDVISEEEAEKLRSVAEEDLND